MLQSVQALVHPVRLQRLIIQPVNLLVSIHASLKLYIASDHTPLSFSVFERGPLCTTARQLVHALAMHYAAGALFRAGKSKAVRRQIRVYAEGHQDLFVLTRITAEPLRGCWFHGRKFSKLVSPKSC